MTRAPDAELADSDASMASTRWLKRFRVIYAACIIALSVQTVLASRNWHDHARLLGTAEISGALLFTLARTQLAGTIVLLFVYFAAAVAHAYAGELPVQLVLYAATAVVILRLTRLAGSK